MRLLHRLLERRFDTAGSSVPYLTGWSQGGEIERYAALIDRLARRLEDAALAASAPDGEAESAMTLTTV